MNWAHKNEVLSGDAMLFILLLKIIVTAIFSSLIITLSSIMFVEIFCFNCLKNKKVEKFLEHDLVRAYLILFVSVIDALLIVGFINLIC